MFANSLQRFSDWWSRPKQTAGGRRGPNRIARARLKMDQLEERLVPASFTFQGRGPVPPDSFLTPNTAYLRVQVPTLEGDQLKVVVQLTSDDGPGEAGEVLYNNKLFADAHGKPLLVQELSILSSPPGIGPSGLISDTNYDGSSNLYTFDSGKGQFIVFAGAWDGDEQAVINLTLNPNAPRDVTSLVPVTAHRIRRQVRTQHDVELTLTNNAVLSTFVPASSPNPSAVPLALQGPFYVVLDNLPRRDHLLNRDGYTMDGRPYVKVYPGTTDGVLDKGRSLTTNLFFRTPGPAVPPHFTTEVWAGQSPP
jgi:hypothetical protein